MDKPRIRRLQGLSAKALLQSVLFSVPLLLFGMLTVYQTRHVANEVDAAFKEDAAVSGTVREAIAKFAEAGGYAHNNDPAAFETSSNSFDLLMKALAWGTESRAFQIDNDGVLWKKWQESGWQKTIGSVHASDKIRQLANKTALSHQDFSGYMLAALSQKPPSESAPKDVGEHEYLVMQNLRRLLDEVAQDALERRAAVVKLQFLQMRRSFIFAILLFLMVTLTAWAFFYKDIVRPLAKLTGQVERVRAGDMSVRLPLNLKDEIGLLARAFNHLIEDLDKTTVSRDVLTKEIKGRKALEEKFRQSEKMGAVGQLAGGIAHDLNNGLTPVAGYLDMLLLDEGLNEASKQMLAEAKQATQRCAEVVRKLMSVSRPSELVKSRLNVLDVLNELKKLLVSVFPATISVVVECPDDIGAILANETDLVTVLMNLAINARDAMLQSGGKFAIKASNVGEKVFLCVSDTGAGMSPMIQSRIFEPFFTTKVKGQGTGLGLAMVYNIIKQLGGSIEVSSTEGKGTSFYIYLPRHLREQEKGSSAQLRQGTRGDALVRGVGAVLFVDDEEILRSMGKAFLERLGYEVMLAQDGEAAVEVFRQKHATIKVVVLDMTMPKLSGMETIRRLLQIDAAASIVATSGFTAEGTTQEILAAGAKAFIEKPYTIDSLGQALRPFTSSPR